MIGNNESVPKLLTKFWFC